MAHDPPWRRLSEMTLEADGLTWQLQRELCPGHALYGVGVRAIARRQDNDDVLFAIEDGTDRVALVRLTWGHRPPEDPCRPETTWFEDLRTFATFGVRFDEE